MAQVQMTEDDDDGPVIDLHESEWRHEGEKEPFWGPNAAHFGIMFLLSIPISLTAHFAVTFVARLLTN